MCLRRSVLWWTWPLGSSCRQSIFERLFCFWGFEDLLYSLAALFLCLRASNCLGLLCCIPVFVFIPFFLNVGRMNEWVSLLNGRAGNQGDGSGLKTVSRSDNFCSQSSISKIYINQGQQITNLRKQSLDSFLCLVSNEQLKQHILLEKHNWLSSRLGGFHSLLHTWGERENGQPLLELKGMLLSHLWNPIRKCSIHQEMQEVLLHNLLDFLKLGDLCRVAP